MAAIVRSGFIVFCLCMRPGWSRTNNQDGFTAGHSFYAYEQTETCPYHLAQGANSDP